MSIDILFSSRVFEWVVGRLEKMAPHCASHTFTTRQTRSTSPPLLWCPNPAWPPNTAAPTHKTTRIHRCNNVISLIFFVGVPNGIYAIRRCLRVAHRVPWSLKRRVHVHCRGCCNSGIICDKNNKHPYIFAISSISSARWYRMVCLPYDRDFMKQHNNTITAVCDERGWW